jgi:ATP-binding cassette, subfamily C (CFTR/MRP), member 1
MIPSLLLCRGQVGYATLAGLCVIIAGIPFTRQVSSHLKSIQKQLSKVRDERVKLCNEVFSGMKIIKLQAWERQFQQKIQSSRDKELALLRRYMIVQSFASAIYGAIPLLVSITTFTGKQSLQFP